MALLFSGSSVGVRSTDPPPILALDILVYEPGSHVLRSRFLQELKEFPFYELPTFYPKSLSQQPTHKTN